MLDLYDSAAVVADLKARLPELTWRLREVQHLASRLPSGLFVCAHHESSCTVQQCIAEIHTDLDTLSEHRDYQSVAFLARLINRKIEVLLRLSQVLQRAKAATPSRRWGLDRLATRQHWLLQLQQEITSLTAQQAALSSALARMMSRQEDASSITVLQAELRGVVSALAGAESALANAVV